MTRCFLRWLINDFFNFIRRFTIFAGYFHDSNACPGKNTRNRPGPRSWMPLLPQSSLGRGWGGHKNCLGPGLNFKFTYRAFRRRRRPLKCKNPPIKIGVVSYNEYKSHILIFTRRLFLFYIKNALVRKNKERAGLKRF